MPPPDGMELLKQTRQTHPDLMFVMLTAVLDPHIAQQAFLLGACDYLVKPLDIEELDRSLKQALQKHHSLVQKR